MDKAEVLKWLKRKGSRRVADGMSRYGIQTKLRIFGVSMGTMQSLAKKVGKDHALAAALWSSGWYEAHMMAALVGEPEKVTRREMNAWVADFDNWGICDTVCFFLFDRTPLAWNKVAQWSNARPEFVKRAAFALLASLAGHDKASGDDRFLHSLTLIERAASDDRNFVKKAVSWALRRIGGRSVALNDASVALARRLSESSDVSARWIGLEALRDFNRPAARQRLARASRAPKRSTGTQAPSSKAPRSRR